MSVSARRIWRRIRRLRRSNVVATAILVVALVLMAAFSFGSDAEVFEAPRNVSRDQGTPIVIAAGDPVVLGYAGPLSGPLADETPNVAIAGVLAWMNDNGRTIHGHPIELVGEDDGGTVDDVALVAANLLIERPGLVAIVGPVFSTAANATIEAYANSGVVMVSGSATRRDLTVSQPQPPYFFRTAFTNAIQGQRQAEILIDRVGVGSALIIDDAETYGIDLAQSAVAALGDAGWAINRLSVPQGTVDFTTVVEGILAEAPDAVVYEGFNPDGALFLRQLRDAGYAGLFVTGDGVVSQTAFLDVLGDRADGAILTDAVARVAQSQPDGSLVIDPRALRDAVAATDTIGWASGQRIAFDAVGDRLGEGAEAGLVACEIRDGVFTEIE